MLLVVSMWVYLAWSLGSYSRIAQKLSMVHSFPFGCKTDGTNANIVMHLEMLWMSLTRKYNCSKVHFF